MTSCPLIAAQCSFFLLRWGPLPWFNTTNFLILSFIYWFITFSSWIFVNVCPSPPFLKIQYLFCEDLLDHWPAVIFPCSELLKPSLPAVLSGHHFLLCAQYQSLSFFPISPLLSKVAPKHEEFCTLYTTVSYPLHRLH